jgi:hypothetical protein
VRGPYALAYCDSNPLGCQCDQGRCVPALCGSDADCGAQVCRDGACVPPPSSSTVAACEVFPKVAAIRSGASETFSVLATTASGAPVVLPGSVTWTALTSAVSVTGGNGGPSTVYTANGNLNVALTPGVRASIGSARCEARVLVFGAPVPAGAVEAVVTDALTGFPIANASLVAHDATTGALLAGPAQTNASGWAQLTGIAVANVTVSAFHASYDFLTIAGYPTSGTRALAMPLTRTRTSYGGHTGTFTGVPQSSDVHVANAGLAFAGSYGELSRVTLQGPPVLTHVVIGSAVNTFVDIPQGMYASFASSSIKPVVASFGAPGACANDTHTIAGTCATRAAWAFSGDLPLGDVPLEIFVGGALDEALLLQRLAPTLRRLSSTVTRDVGYSLRPAPAAMDGGFDYSDLSQHTPLDQPWNQLPLGLEMVATVPALPQFGGAPLRDAVLLAGSLTPGRGFVPLGTGVGWNTMPVDAQLDSQSQLAPGRVPVRLAPTHHRLEGQPYVFTAHVRSDRTPPLAFAATAGLATRLTANTARFDPFGTNPVAFPPFAPIPEGFTWTQGSRTFGFTAPLSLTGQSALAVSFIAPDGTRWVVVGASPSFRLPSAPGGFADRSVGARLRAEVLRLQPAQAGATVSFPELVEHDAVDLDDLLSTTVAFSIVEQL